MEQLFFAGKAYLKINSLVKTPLHEFMAVERSGLWAPGFTYNQKCVCEGLSKISSNFTLHLIKVGKLKVETIHKTDLGLVQTPYFSCAEPN